VSQEKELLAIHSVREVIGDLLSKGQFTLDQAAIAMEMSARTLQRRLAEQGLSYSGLVDEVRFFQARELILHQKKLMDVAIQLGYSDAGSFTRAFERWTGMTPMQYRKFFYQTKQFKKASQKK
jgi:AraC-like DNA-binding protein